MPIEVKVPETNSTIEFPDDTPEQEMVQAVETHIRESSQPAATAAATAATPASTTPVLPDTSYADRGSKQASNLMDRVMGAANSAVEWVQTPLASPKGMVSKYLKDYPMAQGVVEAGEEAVGGFTSPLNIGIMLGARKLPPAGQRALSAAFAVDMTNNAAHQVGSAIEAMQRGDSKSAAKEWTHAILGGGMSKMAMKHAATEPAAVHPTWTQKAVEGVLKDEKDYQAQQEAYRNPPAKEPAVVPQEKAEFYSEGQVEPVERIAAPKKSAGVKPVVGNVKEKIAIPPPKEATVDTLQTTAAVTAEKAKPIVEQQSKSVEPVPSTEYDLVRAEVPKIETPVDPYATEWGLQEPTKSPVMRAALKAVSTEPVEPVAKSSVLQPDRVEQTTVPTRPEMQEIQSTENRALLDTAERSGQQFKSELGDMAKSTESPAPTQPEKTNDSSVYLGSGFGALQNLYDRVTSGLSANKLLTDVVKKTQRGASKFSEVGDDFLLPLRKLDELAGLSMAAAQDLAKSSYVKARMFAGTAGAAAHHIIKLNVTNVKHRQELRSLAKKEGLPRTERRDLLPLSFKWRQLVALTEDVPAKLAKDVEAWQKKVDLGEIDPTKEEAPTYEYPEGKTLEDLKADRQAIEQRVGPKMLKEFQRQAGEYRNQQWDYLENILVKPYWAPEEIRDGKPYRQPGVMSQEAFNTMKKENPNYISLKRVFEDMAEEDNRYAGGTDKFKVTKNTAIQNRKQGSSAKLSDPIAESNNDIFRAIHVAMRNSVLHSIVDLREHNPAMQSVIKPVYEGYKAGRNEHVMVLRNAGKPNRYVVPRDLAPVLERMDKVQLDTVADFIAKANRVYRDSVTSTLKFQFGNLGRDFLTAMTTSAHKHTIPLVISYARGLFDSVLRDTKVSNDLYMEYLKNFAGSSGLKEWLVKGEGMEQIDRLNKDLTHPGTFNLPKKAFRAWQYAGETTELGPRMMAFRNALEAGESPFIAAYRARNITVDFAKHGANTAVNVARQLTPFVGARWQGTKMMLNTIGEGAKALPGVRNLEKYGMAPSRLNKAQKANLAISLGSIGALAAMSQVYNLLFTPESYAQVDDDEKNNKLFFMSNVKDELGRYKVLGAALPTNEFNFFIEPIRGFITYLYHENPNAFLEFARKFFPDLPESPVETKASLGKTVMSAASAVSPYSFTRNGEFSMRELLASATPPHAQAIYAAVLGNNPRTGAPIDKNIQARPRDRYMTDKSVRPSALAAGNALNKVMDVLGMDEKTAIRSHRVLQETVNQSFGSFPMDIGDAITRGVNSATGKQVFEDPSANLGRPTEGMGSAALSRFTTVRPSTYDSDEAQAVTGLKQEHGSKNIRLAAVAETYIALKRQKKDQEAQEFLKNFVTNKLPESDEAGVNYLLGRIKTLSKIEDTNKQVREYNTQNKTDIPELTNTEIGLLGESSAIKAQRFIQKVESLKTPAGKQRLLVEWEIKGLLNDKVIDSIIEQKQKSEKSATQ